VKIGKCRHDGDISNIKTNKEESYEKDCMFYIGVGHGTLIGRL